MKSYRSYFIVVVAMAVLGALLSFGAQPGGINAVNAFIAVVIGPWSRVLSPNAHPFHRWETGDYLLPVLTTLIVLGVVSVSQLPKKKVGRIAVKVLAHMAVVFWCLCGFVKIIVESS